MWELDFPINLHKSGYQAVPFNLKVIDENTLCFFYFFILVLLLWFAHFYTKLYSGWQTYMTKGNKDFSSKDRDTFVQILEVMEWETSNKSTSISELFAHVIYTTTVTRLLKLHNMVFCPRMFVFVVSCVCAPAVCRCRTVIGRWCSSRVQVLDYNWCGVPVPGMDWDHLL